MKKLLKSLVTIAVIGTMALCVAGCKPYKSVEDYVNSDIIQSEVESTNENSDDIKMEITAEGDALVYQYTYSETITDEEELAFCQETFESELSANESTFVDIADSLYDVADVKDPSVIVRYLNADGSVIYETEFPASK